MLKYFRAIKKEQQWAVGRMKMWEDKDSKTVTYCNFEKSYSLDNTDWDSDLQQLLWSVKC